MKKILLLAACAAFWTSCSNDDSACSPAQPTAIRVKASIAGITSGQNQAPESRTIITGSTAAWTDGDVIGLFSPQSEVPGVNVQYSLSGSTWSTSTPLYWLDGTTNHKFLAYVPYASGNTSAATVKVPAIGTQTGTLNPAQDLLISSNLNSTGVTRGSNGTIGLVFTHAFSLIEFKMQIGAGVATGTTLTSFIVAGAAAEKLYTSDATSTIDLSTGAFTATATTNTATVTPATGPTLTTATPVSVYALLLPGTYAGPTLTVNVKDGGTTAFTTATIPIGTTTFDAAKKYTYTVTITRTAITISNPIITEWVTVNGSGLNPGI